MPRSLVMHPGALGDVLLAIPALRAIRRARPGAELVLAAQSHVGELLRALEEVDACVRFERLGLEALFAEGAAAGDLARLSADDRVVCWFGARDPVFRARLREIVPGAVIAPSVPCRHRPGDARALAESDGGDGSNCRPRGESDGAPVWEHLVRSAGGDVGAADRAPVTVSRQLQDAGRAALERVGWDGETPLLFLHVGASGPAKRWAVDGFVDALAAASGFAIVAHEGPSDAEPVRAILSRLPAGTMHLGNPSLPLLAGALGHAGVWLGNDSGVSHLAATVGVPSIVLFTSELIGWAPWAHGVTTPIVSTTTLRRDDVDAVVRAVSSVAVRAGAASP